MMNYWNIKAKRLLKSELVKRGVSNSDLAILLKGVGFEETKSGIDSKISRGTFSASFFLQSLSVIGCKNVSLEGLQMSKAADPIIKYERTEK